MTKSIAAFQDDHGRITTWPSNRRRVHQLAVLSHLSAQLEGGHLYTEAELTTFLNEQTTLEDVSVLRRELVEGDYLMMENGTYWKAGSRPTGTVPTPSPQAEAAMHKPIVK
ncbi:DUF2087 domain-containing protein [Deinococcus psychrotolerans]|uniref:DUF2087 domain-containing protein n=2 Tax=Deinococcus TaxID=1298 RepID=A0A553V1A9_9DEIO|nr:MULTISPECIES: DUF2087 domain-containing protein [Deinococcus]AZI42015.1 DUF2087 domain-containing protein [Deinococcus psychrotolerans]TSA86194.1 DUF2087 domain-containing protein [Deinococcus detaillensis]